MTAWAVAGLGVLLEVVWLAAVAMDHNATLALAEALDAVGAGPALSERAIDAAVLLPLLGIGALFAVLARRAPPRGGLPRGLAVALPAAAALLLAAVFLPLRDYLLYRFAPVEEGVLYRSGQTSEATLERIVERHGIRTLFFLRNPGKELERERSFAEQHGLRFLHVSKDDHAWGAGRFWRVMDDPANFPVLIHCRYGIARTGLIAAVYRMEYQGWDNERALREARLFGGFGNFGEDSNMRGFLLSYVPRQERRARRNQPD